MPSDQWPYIGLNELEAASYLATCIEEASLRNYSIRRANNQFELAEAAIELFHNLVTFSEVPFHPVYVATMHKLEKQFVYGFGFKEGKEYPAGYQKIKIKSGRLMRSVKDMEYQFTEENLLGDKRLDFVCQMPSYGEAIQHGLYGIQSVHGYIRDDGTEVKPHNRRVNLYPRPFFTLYRETLPFIQNVLLHGVAYAFDGLFKAGRTNLGKHYFWGN